MRRTRMLLAAAAAVLLLIGWLAWSAVQARWAVAHSAAARRAVAGCRQQFGDALVYRVSLLGRGALCSALVHQQTFYWYAAARLVPAHWSRLDCIVLDARGVPFCSAHTLNGIGDWIALAGPPAPEVVGLGR